MTVQEVIDKMQQVKDKTAPLFIDCPHCGAATEFKEVIEVAVVRGKKEQS